MASVPTVEYGFCTGSSASASPMSSVRWIKEQSAQIHREGLHGTASPSNPLQDERRAQNRNHSSSSRNDASYNGNNNSSSPNQDMSYTNSYTVRGGESGSRDRTQSRGICSKSEYSVSRGPSKEDPPAKTSPRILDALRKQQELHTKLVVDKTEHGWREFSKLDEELGIQIEQSATEGKMNEREQQVIDEDMKFDEDGNILFDETHTSVRGELQTLFAMAREQHRVDRLEVKTKETEIKTLSERMMEVIAQNDQLKRHNEIVIRRCNELASEVMRQKKWGQTLVFDKERLTKELDDLKVTSRQKIGSWKTQCGDLKSELCDEKKKNKVLDKQLRALHREMYVERMKQTLAVS